MYAECLHRELPLMYCLGYPSFTQLFLVVNADSNITKPSRRRLGTLRLDLEDTIKTIL